MSLSRAAALSAGLLAVPFVSELRIKRSVQPHTGEWLQIPVVARGSTLLGISFRPLQAKALGLDPASTLRALLEHPFTLLRLGAYWNQLEPSAGQFRPEALDSQIEAAEQAGKQIILCAGAIKTFGYPEFFVPPHLLERPLTEGSRIAAHDRPELLEAALTFTTRIVERYRDRKSIVAWQVEHEAVDPLGMEHSWRLGAAFVRREVEALRAADPTRPVMLNGFLPTSLVVRLQQWRRTRDQGDSLALAGRLADIVGIDYYPRHALGNLGGRSLYLDGGESPWQVRRRRRFIAAMQAGGRGLMIAEGQAEPWEAVTTPPSPAGGVMYSCTPHQMIETYNRCMKWTQGEFQSLYAYLFWGAEYWLLREREGDPSYVQAFARILKNA